MMEYFKGKGIVVIPAGKADDISMLGKIKDRMFQILERNPTNDELKQELGWNDDQLAEAKAAMNFSGRISLDDSFSPDDPNAPAATLGTLPLRLVDEAAGETVASYNHSGAAERNLEEAQLIAGVEKALAQGKLNHREVMVIRLRFFEDMTLEEVGEILFLSREMIRQIEKKAKEKLRKSPVLKNLALNIK